MKIEPQYVTIEIAKLLDDKGCEFNSERNQWIFAKDRDSTDRESKMFITTGHQELENATQIDEEHYHNVYHCLSIPEIWQVIEWLRLNHSVWIYVTRNSKFTKDRYYGIVQYEGNERFDHVAYDTPQEAYLAVINYYLTEIWK